jgi:hypothetical protein
MCLDIVLVEEVQHGNLSLISGRSINSVIRHLNLGVIIKDDTADDNFAKRLINYVTLT